ncbi:hypothetical protein ACXZ9C_11390 [Streptococcus agalactiae]
MVGFVVAGRVVASWRRRVGWWRRVVGLVGWLSSSKSLVASSLSSLVTSGVVGLVVV